MRYTRSIPQIENDINHRLQWEREQREMEQLSIGTVENLWQSHRYSNAQVDEYIEKWNAGPHFTTAKRGVNHIYLIDKRE